MATDKKISDLTVATTPSGAELVEIVQGGVNKQTTLQQIADLAGDEHFKGVYANEAALISAHPTAAEGDYAYVDAGVASPVELWIWDDDDDEWVQSGGAAGGTWGSITGTLSSQTDLNTALGLKAPLASPTFTGTPAAPTASQYTATTQVATTAFVQSKIDAHLTIKTKIASHALDSNDLADVNLGKALNFIMDVAAPNDFTIPPNSTWAGPIGTQFLVDYTNTGATSFVAGLGVTILSADGLTIAARYKGIVAKKIATNTWLLQGALTT